MLYNWLLLSPENIHNRIFIYPTPIVVSVELRTSAGTKKFIASRSNNIFYIQIHHFTQTAMLNQSLYYTIQYHEPNTKSMSVVTTPLGSKCRKIQLGSLKVKISLYYNVVDQILVNSIILTSNVFSATLGPLDAIFLPNLELSFHLWIFLFRTVFHIRLFACLPDSLDLDLLSIDFVLVKRL